MPLAGTVNKRRNRKEELPVSQAARQKLWDALWARLLAPAPVKHGSEGDRYNDRPLSRKSSVQDRMAER
jgi:hypothetical protein